MLAVVRECNYHSGEFCHTVRIRQVLKSAQKKSKAGKVGVVKATLRPVTTFAPAPIIEPTKVAMALSPRPLLLPQVRAPPGERAAVASQGAPWLVVAVRDVPRRVPLAAVGGSNYNFSPVSWPSRWAVQCHLSRMSRRLHRPRHLHRPSRSRKWRPHPPPLSPLLPQPLLLLRHRYRHQHRCLWRQRPWRSSLMRRFRRRQRRRRLRLWMTLRNRQQTPRLPRPRPSRRNPRSRSHHRR